MWLKTIQGVIRIFQDITTAHFFFTHAYFIFHDKKKKQTNKQTTKN